MAYMRGINHVWSDEGNVHFDNQHQKAFVPNKVMDEYVVMRFAEMSEEEIALAENRAIENHRENLGCDGLSKKHRKPTVKDQLRDGLQRRIDSRKK